MKIISAIDSMKGSLTSMEANEIIATVFSTGNYFVEQVAIADGGEGTVEAFIKNSQGRSIQVACHDLLGREIMAPIGWLEASQTAVIESAATCGIHYLDFTETTHPSRTSSKGVGEQIEAAINLGAKRIIIGLGGTGTIDGGLGALDYLGVRFFDKRQKRLSPQGSSLGAVASVSTEQLMVDEVEFILAADVKSPLTGPTGAVYMFGEQKGLVTADLSDYEASLQNYEGVLLQGSPSELGDGAAGGLGLALRIFLKAQMVSGFELLAEEIGLEKRIQTADLVITGEGRMDNQSLQGKVPVAIGALAKKAGIPALAFVGLFKGEPAAFAEAGITAVIPIIDQITTVEEAMNKASENLTRSAERVKALLELTLPTDN